MLTIKKLKKFRKSDNGFLKNGHLFCPFSENPTTDFRKKNFFFEIKYFNYILKIFDKTEKTIS